MAGSHSSEGDAIVTFNLRDFPADACDPYDVEVLHPDRFLVELYDLDRAAVEAEITAQAAASRRPPVSRSDLVQMLERAGVPTFAARLVAAVDRT